HSGWVFEPARELSPPRLPADFLRDFDGLLGQAAAVGVRMWPVLLGFEFFGPLLRSTASVSSGGRSAFVFGRSGSEASIERFFDATLAPLLDVARARSSAVGAFEVMNEPDWAVRRNPFGFFGRGSIGPAAMGRFLVLGARRIAEAGFLATIGFTDAEPSWLARRERDELARLGASGAYVHQLHHYPGTHRPRRLRPHAELPIRPCIVGELPSSLGTWGPSNHMRWEDAGLAETAADRFLIERLALIERLGYPGAFVWGLHSRDGATSWSEGQESQIRQLVARIRKGENGPQTGGDPR
ncbi:MAG: hypothetical protein H5U40_09725, partial [Polyangiaceae bacterium]|nr:hypothetical protein [Polyangiaceae bacterium]